MSITIARMLAGHDAAEERYKENRAARLDVRLPSVVAGVERPLTVYRPSGVHDAMMVVYESKGSPRSARSSWAVPGTWEVRS